MESMVFFSLTATQNEYVLYTWFNIDNSGQALGNMHHIY